MKKLNLLFCLACLLVVSACKKDNDPEPNNQSTDSSSLTSDQAIKDLPKEVSKVIIFKGGEKKEGTPPPTSDSSLNLNNSFNPNEYLSPGMTAVIDLDYSTSLESRVTGAYVGVQNGEGYFQVSKAAAGARKGLSPNLLRMARAYRQSETEARELAAHWSARMGKADSNSFQLNLTLPATTPTGSFCVSYCLFDAQGNVGNVVTRCFNVIKKDKSFNQDLVANWTATKIWDYSGSAYNGFIIRPGNTWKDTSEVSSSTGTSTTVMPYYTESKFISFDFNFAQNKDVLWDFKSDMTLTDYPVSGYCFSQNAYVMKDTTFSATDVFTGTWDYDETTGILTESSVYDTSLSTSGDYGSCEFWQGLPSSSFGSSSPYDYTYGIVEYTGSTLTLLDDWGNAWKLKRN